MAWMKNKISPNDSLSQISDPSYPSNRVVRALLSVSAHARNRRGFDIETNQREFSVKILQKIAVTKFTLENPPYSHNKSRKNHKIKRVCPHQSMDLFSGTPFAPIDDKEGERPRVARS
jgi:hypothetical protein